MYHFNLAFGHPAKDLCTKFRLCLKDRNIAQKEKCFNSVEFMLHRCKARKFYQSLNNVGDSFTIAFVMMETLVLPKSPIILFKATLSLSFRCSSSSGSKPTARQGKYSFVCVV